MTSSQLSLRVMMLVPSQTGDQCGPSVNKQGLDGHPFNTHDIAVSIPQYGGVFDEGCNESCVPGA